MAIGRVSGPMLQPNLVRQGTDLAFETDLLYLDVTNSRIGINEATPGYSLDIAGDLQVGNVEIDTNTITTTNVDGNLVLDANGVGHISVSSKNIQDVATPILGTDAANKAYVDSLVGGSSGSSFTLGSPTDGSLTTCSAYLGWTTSTLVVDAIDDLNEVIENIRNNTFVKEVDFTANQTVGGAGLVVTLTITATGNANRYDIDWGDGNTTTGTSDSTPTHTYNSNVGSPFDVEVRAYNNSGCGTGSEATKVRAGYIIIYTANPVVTFAAYTAASGGSPITYWDDGDTVYFENDTTNIGGATIQYTWDWGDGSSDDVINTDSDPGGSTGSRLAHTFTASTEQERTRTVTLTLDSHTTADPSVIPTNDNNSYKIYDDHTPTVTLSGTTGINEEGTSGLPITFTNTTEATIGSYATYGIQYQYQWGDGTSNTTVNVGTGGSGDTGNTIAHTFALSAGDQASGTARDYTGNLRVISNHSSSPFISSDFTVHVEPDVRANIAATAVTVSDRSGDNQYDIYDYTDYNGNNRALVRATNTSQNADDYVYDWDDLSTDNVTEDGVSAGSIGAVLDHDYAGESTGNYNLSFTANGTPDITAQTDVDTSITFTMNATPAAPDGLSAKSITLSDSYQGTSPKLCSGFTDNSATNPLVAGASLTTTTARRYISGTIDTSTVANAYNGLSGTLTAIINGVDSGNKTFTSALNENGTFTSLVVSDQRDAHDTISSATYPTGFYQTFDAKITQSLGSYSVGVNDQRLEHSATGNTNYVSVVYDDVTATPTISSVGTLSEGTAGTKRYISGVPYYNTGSPTLNLTGVQISNLTGQAYRDTGSIVEVDNGTNQEGTSSAGTSDANFTYAQIDGASSMLTGGIPNANTGVASPYTLGTLSIPITSSSVRTVDRVKVRASNCNGTSSYSEVTATDINVHTASQSGINELVIAVADSLGNGTYTDDGIRSTAFLAETTDTPTFNGATNFYTSSLYTESSDPGVSGTKEATIRLGVLKYDVTDYSSGFLPVGPDRSGDTGTQYFTFAFRRQVVANFDINITSSSGISGLWIAAPGTAIDSASGLNGWLDSSTTYGGSGVPGSDVGNGGNGSDGCAFTSGDRIATGVSLSGGYTMTLGAENMSNATGNVVLVRIALASGESVTAISVGEAA